MLSAQFLPVLPRGVNCGLELTPQSFRPRVPTPDLSKVEEEQLITAQVGEVVGQGLLGDPIRSQPVLVGLGRKCRDMDIF